MSSRRRQELINQMAVAIRLFMAHAVIFQEAVAKQAGLNTTDVQCAGLLMLEGPLTPSELASRIGLTAGGAITAVVDRLEAAGLVHRVRDDADRRRVQVTPDTEALTQRVGPLYARVGKRWNDYLATLDDEQLALVIDVLNHATNIDREEIEALRALSPQPRGTPARSANKPR
jgi:DNA-binding MarR family transcriptional regulator